MTTRTIISALAVSAASFAAFPALAQDYPTKAVEFIVPFAPGGGADASQRAFNKYAEPLVGHPLPINNKPGAAGTTGWAEMVRANNDGYTLTIVTPPFNIIPALVKPKETGYTLDQFTNICVYAVVPDVILVRKDSEYKTLEDFVTYAKANPKKVAAANSGTLGADFMTTLLIEKATGIQMSQVPFSSGALALQAMLGSTTDTMVASTLYAVAQADTLVALAIAAEERDPLIPDVPTFTELGYDVISKRLRVLAGPPGLPENVVSYWADICKQVTDNPEFKAEMDTLGQPVSYEGPEEANAMITRMTADMQSIVDTYKLAE
jgi:tripartite-type tricarboxylate transporter receptor subunit TctC